MRQVVRGAAGLRVVRDDAVRVPVRDVALRAPAVVLVPGRAAAAGPVCLVETPAVLVPAPAVRAAVLVDLAEAADFAGLEAAGLTAGFLVVEAGLAGDCDTGAAFCAHQPTPATARAATQRILQVIRSGSL